MPPSMENTEYKDRLMEPSALNVQKVYPKLRRALSSAITSVKDVHSSRKPLMMVSKISPAMEAVSAYSMLILMLLRDDAGRDHPMQSSRRKSSRTA